MPPRKLFVAVFTSLIASLALAASAQADDFCVGSPASCPAGATMVSGGSLGADLQSAIDLAITSASDSSVYLGAGVFDAADGTGGRFLARDYAHELNIYGSGRDQTILRRDGAGGQVIDFGGITQASVIKSLTVDRIGTPDLNQSSAAFSNATGEDLQVNAHPTTPITSGQASSASGGAVYLSNASLTNVDIDSQIARGIVIVGSSGSTNIDDVRVTGIDVLNTTGIINAASIALSLNRVKVSDFYNQIASRRGSITLTDSVVSGGSNGFYGISLWHNGDQTASIDAKRVTVVLERSNGRAANVYTWNGSGDPYPLTLTIADSLLVVPGGGSAYALGCAENAPGEITVALPRTAYNHSLVLDSSSSDTCAITGSAANFDSAASPPLFVDAANNDFSQRWDSPWLDQVDDPALSGEVDVVGNERLVRGTAPFAPGGSALLDLGAIEYQAAAPVATIDAAPSGLVGASLAFAGSGSDSDPGESAGLTYSWDFGDGGTATGTSANHTWSLAGTYAVKLTVTDPAGRVGSATKSVTIGALPIPADTTAPKLTIKSKPKKKTKSRKVRISFKANEAATFECKLDRAKKWKKCKSPYKAKKLKRGKHTLSVRATDAAGNVSKVKKISWRVTSK